MGADPVPWGKLKGGGMAAAVAKPIVGTLRLNMRTALAAGRLDDAGQILDRLQREDPASLETRGLELEHLLLSGRLQEAESLGRQLCRLFPDSARVHFLWGKVCYRLRRYERAEAGFRESLKLHQHWQGRYWLGRALTQTGAFEEAEALLVESRARLPRALMDLAWLHERRGDLAAAAEACEAYLALEPDDRFAQEQRTRLKARLMDPAALLEEMEQLEELGEEVPESLLPEYVRSLFENGQAPKARAEVEKRKAALEPRAAVSLAWVCYRARAHDLAFEIFLSRLDENLANAKFLVALETAARRSGRAVALLKAYESRVERHPSLHGRIGALMRRPSG